VPASDEELSFYRAVEDLFAAVRGVPHTLSPKDFQLLRGWWRDQVPLAAIANGITEVMAKRRDRGDQDPIVSLSYCRHAVGRHTKRLAEMHVGVSASDGQAEGAGAGKLALGELIKSLREISLSLRRRTPEVSAVIGQIADQLDRTPEMPPALLEEHLFSIEAVLLDRSWRALPEVDRNAIDERCAEAVDESLGTAATRDRTMRAIRDRELRTLLALPRLELS